MTPPLLGVGEENGSNGILLTSSTVIESVGRNSPGLKEHNYLGLSDCSSVDSSTITTGSDESKTVLNLKATELRLGLPGSQSPPRDQDFNLCNSNPPDEKPLFPLHPSSDGHYTSPHKALVLGNKRGFSAAMDGFSQEKYHAHSEDNVMLSPRPNSNLGLKSGSVLDSLGAHTGIAKEVILHNKVQEGSNNANDDGPNQNVSTMTNSSAPATKAQVVGWPPIRSFRKNSLTTATKNSNEVDGKTAAGALFVKVCMDGAPYLRKVDLRNYSAYQELSSALEKMFSCFTIGQYGTHGGLGREMMSESKIKDLLHGSEYVLTYEDKDSDWMLVGDVPWEMFIESCKRLRIMKSSDAIGLAPRAVDKLPKQKLTSTAHDLC